ncbi:MAG TPA: 1-acyl-sn-glycerol-3-phosphate acyltransferase [Mollicutes bacterium]|nr:1-acyl-sn-glycerol-3-phosphate acyltransferase [Mollicutes bacterium]
MKESLLYKLIRPLLIIWFYPTYRPMIINNKVIPKKAGAILAGNHTSKKDCFILGSSTRRPIRFLAKDELTSGRFGFLFKKVGLIPVNRREKDNTVIPASVEALNNDAIIAIFPESTINKTKDIIMPFKTGAVRIAIESGKPIIPFAISGNYTKWKKNVKITFGKPYFPKSKNIEKENKILENKVIALLENKR